MKQLWVKESQCVLYTILGLNHYCSLLFALIEQYKSLRNKQMLRNKFQDNVWLVLKTKSCFSMSSTNCFFAWWRGFFLKKKISKACTHREGSFMVGSDKDITTIWIWEFSFCFTWLHGELIQRVHTTAPTWTHAPHLVSEAKQNESSITSWIGDLPEGTLQQTPGEPLLSVSAGNDARFNPWAFVLG